MKVRFKKLSENAVIPTKAHPTDAGFDLTATSISHDNGSISYGTGIAVEIPEGYVGLVFPRSSICRKSLFLTNGVGVVDECYRGEIFLKFKPAFGLKNVSEEQTMPIYRVGERIGQLIILPYPEIEFEEASELSETDRGDGGYGSTGK